MEPNAPLDVLLPQLFAKLIEFGLPPVAAKLVCRAIEKGKPPAKVRTAEAYLTAWSICHALEEILTNTDDGSEVADWYLNIASKICDYEDAFEATHGYMPLNPGPRGYGDGTIGSA